MLSNCGSFKIIGDGSNQIVLIAENTDGTQSGYIVKNPFVGSLEMDNNLIECTTLGGTTHYMSGGQTSSLNIRAGEVEFIEGSNLIARFDPVINKTILDLANIIKAKLNDRKETEC